MLRYRRTLFVIGVLLAVSMLACSMEDIADIGGIVGPSKPSVEILSPLSGTQVTLGGQVEVQYQASDAGGVVRVELEADGQLVDMQASPATGGQPTMTGVLEWTPPSLGTHTLIVRAYNLDRVASDPMGVSITVVEGLGLEPTATLEVSVASPAAPSPTLQPPAATSPPAVSPTPTTAPPTATARPPTLGGKIAYPVYVGGRTHYEIHIADVHGNDLSIISRASEPALDPGGTRIAYRSWDPDFRGMVTANVDGGNPQRPRRGAEPNEDSVPRWSAAGTSLVYATKRFGPHRISHVLTHLLAQRADRDLGEGDNPDWSPDGRLIVASTAAGTGLFIMDSEGGSRRQLTSSNDSSPDWSPTSNKIAFMRLTGNNWDIWVINSDGGGERQLTNDGSVDGLPAWSPDGTSIAFLSNRGGVWAIWVMNADGTNQRKLFNTGSSTYATTQGFDGEWAGRSNLQTRHWYDEQISWSR